MYVIKKLPILLPLFISVIICCMGIYYDYSLEEVSYKLIISIIAFYLIGYILRNIIIKFLLKVLKENEEKIKYIKEHELENNNQDIDDIDNDFEPFIPKKFE